MRDIVCLLELDQRTMARRRKVDGLRVVGSGDERTAKQRTGSTEQVDGGETELSGDDARRGTGNAAGDVEESYERSHRAAPVGGEHAFQGFHAESREDERAAETRDERHGGGTGAQVLNIHT
jgi:hypothetical protein